MNMRLRITYGGHVVHRDVRPDDQILLDQTLAIEEVIEIDERIPNVQVVVRIGTSGLQCDQPVRDSTDRASFTSVSLCFVT